MFNDEGKHSMCFGESTWDEGQEMNTFMGPAE